MRRLLGLRAVAAFFFFEKLCERISVGVNIIFRQQAVIALLRDFVEAGYFDVLRGPTDHLPGNIPDRDKVPQGTRGAAGFVVFAVLELVTQQESGKRRHLRTRVITHFCCSSNSVKLKFWTLFKASYH